MPYQLPDLPVPVIDTISTDRDRLLEDYPVSIEVCGLKLDFTIHAGFENDRSTVPWWARGLYDRSSFGRKSALVHDFLYQTIENDAVLILDDGNSFIVEKWLADVIFFVVALRDGIEPNHAFHGFVAVWLFGGR